MPLTIRTVNEFLAHAIAMEREAAERYREFEGYFTKHGQEVLAGLCGNLAHLEEGHLAELLEESRGRKLPAVSLSDYRWLDSGSPEAGARELFYRVANERQLLEVALGAEHRAQRFFEWVALTTPDERVCELAREMAAEEEQHVAWVEQALEYRPAVPFNPRPARRSRVW